MLRVHLVLGLLSAVTLAGAEGSAPDDLAALYHREWLADVAPLLEPAERAAFDGLDSDALREAFIRRFWEVRDPTPGTGRNELRDRWLSPLAELAAEEARSPDQEAVLRLLGARPRLFHAIPCPPLPRLEVWYVSRDWLPPLAPGVGSAEPFYLLFAEDDADGALRLVSRHDVAAPRGARSLRQRLDKVLRKRRCLLGVPGAEQALADLQAAFGRGLRWDELVARVGVPEPPERWFEELEPAAATGIATPELVLSFPGAVEEKTVVRGLVRLPAEPAAGGPTIPAQGLVLAGEVFRVGEVVEAFRYTFHGLGEDIREALPLTFERSLRPGSYGLRLHLETLRGEPLWSDIRRMTVPIAGRELPHADPVRLDAAEVFRVPDRPTLHLRVPVSGILVGEIPVEATLSGLSGASAVRFVLDGRRLYEDDRPPFEARLDLGEIPRQHTLRAVVLDSEGRGVAEDRAVLNAGPHRFAVRLTDPPPGTEAGPAFTARAEVAVPAGARLDHLELQVNGELRATLYGPPLVQTLPLPEGEEVVFVRAVAHLADGRSAEDVTMVRGGKLGEEMDVQLVELYTTVVDRKGRPVTGLGAGDFTVFDEGEPRPLHGFKSLHEIPLHVCLAVDTSSSMVRAMPIVRESALRFFADVLTPRDRAAVLAFDHRPRILAPLTADLEDLERSVATLAGEGGTALYDALVVGLHYLGGLEGKRAVVLLSDGQDEHSRFGREEVQEYARRAGVAIYTIALGDDLRLRPLERLAHETGGRAFTLRRAEQLPAVYDTIERELRAQYLLTYQPPETAGGDYRRVEVEVARPGLEARTLAGYYPE